MTKLFLDDVRVPTDCVMYMNTRLGSDTMIYLEKWDIVRNYDDFVKHIQTNGLPDIISFDHDLSDEHYDPSMYGEDDKQYDNLYDTFKEKTGYDCAKWLCDYCGENSLTLPKCIVHSMNPVGTRNIYQYLENFKKIMGSK